MAILKLIRHNKQLSRWMKYAGWIKTQSEHRQQSSIPGDGRVLTSSTPDAVPDRCSGRDSTCSVHGIVTPGSYARVLLPWFFLVLGTNIFYVTAEATTLEEYTVKSALTLNLAIFTEWPKSAFTGVDDAIHLCVIGDNTVQESFMQTSGKKIGHRKITLSDITRSGKITGCHILFIGGQDRIQLSRMQAAAAGKPILTIDDINEPTNYRSVVNLPYHDGKIELNINLKLAQQNQLEISARLLKLAHIVSAEPLTDVP